MMEDLFMCWRVWNVYLKTKVQKCYTHLGYLIVSLFTHIAVRTGHLPNCSPRAARLQFDQLVSFSQHSGHWTRYLGLNSLPILKRLRRGKAAWYIVSSWIFQTIKISPGHVQPLSGQLPVFPHYISSWQLSGSDEYTVWGEMTHFYLRVRECSWKRCVLHTLSQ